MPDTTNDPADGETAAETAAGRDIRDVRSLRAFAHPLRVRLYYELGLAGSATATSLAEKTGAAIALVSYHLRQLGTHGFIVPAPERARDGREHWWTLSDRRLDWHDDDFRDTPAGREVSATVKNSLVREQYHQLEQYLTKQDTWDPEWIDAAFHTDGVVELTATELQELQGALAEVVQRFKRRAASDPETARERVVVVLHGFPYRA